MLKRDLITVMLIMLCLASIAYCKSVDISGKKKVIVVDSYHRSYLWSQSTNEGFCAAMLKYGYFDNDDQIKEFTDNDYIETSKVIMKKFWMNTKEKKSTKEIGGKINKVITFAEKFKPDLIFLGDDNAANYIGKRFLDTEIPVVFWGVNNTPVKYGLIDSMEKPGHNVTGIYQAGYQKEAFELLLKLVPDIKTFAILSDDTATGRARVKDIERLAYNKLIHIELVETVMEGRYEKWQQKALELQERVDAFFITQHSGLVNKDGKYVSTIEVVSWYIDNIKVPEAAGPSDSVKLGMLCSVDDSGYNQGFDAVSIAHDILVNGKDPATYPPRFPQRGPIMVNKKRGKQLGITFTEDMGIELYH